MSSSKEKEKASNRMRHENKKKNKEIHEKMTNSYKANENMRWRHYTRLLWHENMKMKETNREKCFSRNKMIYFYRLSLCIRLKAFDIEVIWSVVKTGRNQIYCKYCVNTQQEHIWDINVHKTARKSGTVNKMCSHTEKFPCQTHCID